MVLPHFHAFFELIRSLRNNDCGVVDSVSKKLTCVLPTNLATL